MKIKLIAPLTKGGLLGKRTGFNYFSARYAGAPLALPTLVALTPKDIEISITDENVEKINFEEKCDLVGVSFNVAGATRAYQISEEYRKRGITVVLGGVYTSMVPQEATQYANSIVIGEAEEIWGELLRDFQKGNLQKIYRASQLSELSNSPVPRWDLLKSDLYNYHSLQTTRGCPFDCDYCSVTYLFGGSYRHKPVENIIREIKFLKEIDKDKMIFFVDDNISSNRAYAKNLFNALTPLNIRWYSQAPISVAQDDELLDLMYKSGCRELFIGFESVSQDSLNAMGKGKINKVEEYEKAIKKVYSYGISIFGSFMLGGEFDDENIFKKTIYFINNNNLAFSLINIVVPPPGTRLFEKLDKEGRILDRRWEKYTGEYVTFRPKLITQERLQKGFIEVLDGIYEYNSLYKRLCSWWNIISVKKKKRFAINKLIIKIFLSFGFIAKLKTPEGKKYALRLLWSSKDIPISILFLSLYCHDYKEEIKNATI